MTALETNQRIKELECEIAQLTRELEIALQTLRAERAQRYKYKTGDVSVAAQDLLAGSGQVRGN